MSRQVRQMDPLHLRELLSLVRTTRSLRLVGLVPAPGHEIARMWVYTVTAPQPDIEAEIECRGGDVSGYFGRNTSPHAIVSAVAHSFDVLAERREKRRKN